MASNTVLQWQDGHGWLVFSGGQDTDTIRARVLGTSVADGAVAVLALGDNDLWAEHVLSDLEDLGAQAGYLIEVVTEADDMIRLRLGEAGVIVIGGVDSAKDLHSALTGAAIEAIQQAFENGAVVLIEGVAMLAFGAWLPIDEARFDSGFSWLSNALLVPGWASVGDLPLTQNLMAQHGAALAVGIGPQAALALGPQGQVDIWGDQQVGIALGPDFGA